MYFSDKFYSATKAYNRLAYHVNAPYMRKNFELESVPEKITVTLSGLGFYEIYINGTEITKGILAPYVSNIDDICYYDSYDITNYVRKGRNTLGFILGNGMKNPQGATTWKFNTASFIGAPVLAFSIVYTDGENKVLIEADESIKTHPSPVTFDDTRFGMHYDARLEIENWNSPDFDDSSWKNAFKTASPKGEKRLCEAEPVTVRKILEPVDVRPITLDKTYSTNKDYFPSRIFEDEEYEGYLFDFGINTAGIEEITLNAKAGQKLEFQPCEYINANGHPSYNNLLFYPDGYTQRDIYICKDGEQTFAPKFTYHGFRYMFVNGLTREQAENCKMVFKVYSSDIKIRGKVTTSDEVVNKLIALSENSDLSNFHYITTDCPQREKHGWTGDITVSSEHILLKYTAENSYKEWLRNAVKAQKEDGSLPGIVPTTGWGFDWGNGPVFDNCIEALPFNCYRFTDDITFLKENADAILKYVHYIDAHRNEEGLNDYGLGDWVKPQSELPTANKAISMTCVTVGFCEGALKIFERLGRNEDKEYAEKIGNELKEALRKKIDKNSCIIDGGIMSSMALAIYFGIFSETEKPKAAKALADAIKNNHGPDCGFVGSRALLHALSDNGQVDTAYYVLSGTENYCLGAFTKCDLTALPESFDYLSSDGNPKSWKSLNHHFFGDYVNWLISKIAGIRVNYNFDTARHIDICPAFPKELKSITASFDSNFGLVTSSFENNGDKVTLKVTAANKLFGSIKAPDGWQFDDKTNEKELKTGEYILVKQ